MIRLLVVGDIALNDDYSSLIQNKGIYFPCTKIKSFLKRGISFSETWRLHYQIEISLIDIWTESTELETRHGLIRSSVDR